MTHERIDFLGLPLDTGIGIDTMRQFMREKGLRLVSFINPHAWALAKEHEDYLAALNAMTLVLPDGEGVAAACRILTEKKCPRISFDMTSLADPFFRQAAAEKMTIMLIGGNPGVDEGAQAKLAATYPGIRITGTSHGYDDFEPKINQIIEKNPDIVIVGMGSPRQENFLIALRDAGYTGLAITCGGFFDQYLESDTYYPTWIDHWNLRFAWRLYKEPQRLWRRYLFDYQLFVKLAAEAMYKKFAPQAIQNQFGKSNKA